jgi:hypothetical protein
VNPNRRPLAVTILACLYLLVGSRGLVFHSREILARHAFQYDDLLIQLTEILAILAGAFMLRGCNWARWLALAWILFHVALSAFGPWRGVAIHSLFCIAIAWTLFRTQATQYFRPAQPEPRPAP